MGLPRILGRIFGNPITRAAAQIGLTAFAPGFAPLVNSAFDAVWAAENKFGKGNGGKKLEYAMEFVEAMAPRIVGDIERATGRELVDEKSFMDGVQDLVQAQVKMLNSFRILPKEEAQ